MSETSEQWVERHVELLRALGTHITLDQVGEAVGAQAVTQAQIEALLDALEAAGVTVEQKGAAVVDLLKLVLATARDLRQGGRAATPSAIADRAGMSVRQVRVALLFADVLRR